MNAFAEMDGYFLSAQQGGHVDMIRFDYANKEEMFDGHSYNKGGRILHMLRTYLGDEIFFMALKQLLKCLVEGVSKSLLVAYSTSKTLQALSSGLRSA